VLHSRSGSTAVIAGTYLEDIFSSAASLAACRRCRSLRIRQTGRRRSRDADRNADNRKPFDEKNILNIAEKFERNTCGIQGVRFSSKLVYDGNNTSYILSAETIEIGGYIIEPGIKRVVSLIFFKLSNM